MVDRLSVFFTALLAPMLFASGLAAEAYKLLPQDQVIVRALKWDDVTSSYMLWDGVSGEFKLGTDGDLSVPLAGTIAAAGQTTAAIADQLELRLRRRVGLEEPPHIAVEVSGHLPVYVLGDVSQPGAYPFRPGLTAQQALVLAGGYLRPTESGGAYGTNDGIRLDGQMRLLATEIAALEAERGRIVADLQVLDPGDQSSAIRYSSDAPEGLEADILAAEQSARTSQSERIRDLQAMLREQIARLSTKIGLQQKQIEITHEELKDVSSLNERGLTVKTRVTDLSRTVNDMEARLLDLEIARITARQELNRAERDELALLDDAKSAALVRLNSIDRELESLRTQLSTARAISEQTFLAASAEDTAATRQVTTLYRVTRGSPTATTTDFPATGPIMPGDTLTVVRMLVDAPATD